MIIGQKAVATVKDSFGRNIGYLRISLTRRCNLNCLYCSPETEAEYYEMTADEIELCSKIFAELGVKKIRLTGGEPTMRHDLAEIVRRIKSLKKIKEIAMTTNALNLSLPLARQLKAAGLDRINIGIDSLDSQTYKAITGADRLDDALKGIDAALEAGFQPLRINVVLVKGINDKEVESFISLARDNPLDVRFIELMPFSQGKACPSGLSNADILSKHPQLKPLAKNENDEASGPCLYYASSEFLGRVGFISPISHKFCSDCNRVRLLSDAVLKPCLGHESEVDLKPYLKDYDSLKTAIERAVFDKPAAHAFESGPCSSRGMRTIGG
ncbi:MAG: GTP 3',8-cyclase MoaA [Clostridiales bacterium]|nr:GTP 3',8-cyclase MoaA [Clostridiales bacterium]